MDTSLMAVCGQPTLQGDPCRTTVAHEADVCIWHDESRREEAAELRRKGARTANAKRSKIRTADPDSVPARPETIEDAIEWASWAVWAVACGEIDARTGHEVGYVLRAFLDGRKHADSVDARVKELADKLDKLRAS